MAIKFLNTVAVDTDVLYVDASSNNVGIGTTSPNAKLDIQGTQGQLFSVTDDLSGSIFAVSDISGVPIFDVNSSGVSYFDGNVGIGTTSPQAKLQINNGNLYFKNDSYGDNNRIGFGNPARNGDAGYIDYIGHGNFTGHIAFGLVTTSSNVAASEVARFNNQGNFGIGTTSPGAKLDVAGDIRLNSIGQELQFSNHSVGAYRDGSNRLMISGYGGIRFQAEAVGGMENQATRMVINPSGNVGIGTTSPTSRLEIKATSATHQLVSINRPASDTAALYLGNDSASPANGVISSNYSDLIFGRDQSSTLSEWMRIKRDGNVGIGTTAPNAKLHIGPNSLVSGYTPDRSTLAISDTTNGGQLIIRGQSPRIWFDGTAGGNAELFLDNSKLNILSGDPTALGSSRLYIKEDGNVGIGTTSPIGRLNVVNGTSGQTYSNVSGVLIDVNGSSNSYYGLRVGSNTGNDHFCVTNAGNVGIGNGGPSQKLHITGNVRVTGAYYDSNNSAGTSGQVLSSTATGTDWVSLSEISGVDGTGTANYVAKWSDTDTITDSIIYDDGTNVGIGTPSPSEKLHIYNGTAYVTPISYASNQDAYALKVGAYNNAAFDMGLKIKSTAGGSPYMSFETSTASDVLVMQGANVGIGTTNPDAKLHLSGISQTGSENVFKIENDTSNTKFQIRSISGDYNLQFKNAGNVTRVFLDSNGDSYLNGGNVGIGTTSPSQKLEVAGNIQATGARLISSSFDANHYMRLESNSSGGILKGTDGGVTTTLVRTYGDSYFNGGNFGIGTTSPSQDLTLYRDSGDTNFLISSNNGASQIFFGDTESDNIGKIDYDHSNDSLNFVVNASERMRITSSGNVGIGTTSPSERLQVYEGGLTAYKSYTATNAGAILTAYQSTFSPFTKTTDLVAGSDSTVPSEIRFLTRTSGTSTIDERMRITSAGNVGIGTTSPTYKLQVEGNAYVDSTLSVANTSTSNSYIYLLSSSTGESELRMGDSDTDAGSIAYNNAFDFMAFRANAAERMRIASGGNVGIGTTNPSEKLEVAGNARITGDVTLSNGNALRWTSDDVRIEGTTAGDNIKFYVANTEILQLAQSGTLATVTGNLRVTGAYYDSNNLPGTSGQVLSSTATGTDWVSLSEISGVDGTGTTNYVAKWSDSDTITDSVIYDDGTNVGIGTTSPQDLLHLSADSPVLRLTNTVDTGQSSIEFWDNQSGTSQAGEVFYDDNSNLFGLQGNGNGIIFRANNTFPGSELMRLNGSGNLGIGTTSPSEKLDVVGGSLKVSDTYATVKIIGTGGLSRVFLGDTANEDVGYLEYNHISNYFRIGVNAAERMRIDSSGNVGIGTNSPSRLLDVDGIQGWSLNNVEVAYINPTATGTDFALKTSGINVIRLDGRPNANSFINNGGNVGIGTDSPSSLLHLQSTSSPALQIKDTTNNVTFKAYAQDSNSHLANTSNHDLFIDTNNTSRITVKANGNVGIGTTSPGATLHVESTTSDYVAKFSHTTSDGYAPGSILLQAGQANSRGQGIYHYNTVADESWFTGVPYNVNSKKWIVANQYSTTLNTNVAQLSNALLTIDSDTGNVGIGTTSPAAKLDVAGNIKITSALLSNQENTDVDTGAETVAEVSMADYTAAFFDFVIKKGTNVRSGTVYACHDGGSTPVIEFTEISTQDLGDTSDVVLSVDKTGSGGGSKMRLLATTTSDDWSVKTLIRAI